MTTDATRERILDGAVAVAARAGLTGLTLDLVSGEGGVSRQTVYRYFGSREALIAAAVLREEEAIITKIVACAARHHDLRPALEAAIEAGLTAAREHPLLDRILATEPEALLPYLTTGAAPLLAAAEPAFHQVVRRYLEHLSDPELHRVTDAITRMVMSYAINPGEDSIEDVASGLADLIVEGLKTR